MDQKPVMKTFVFPFVVLCSTLLHSCSGTRNTEQATAAIKKDSIEFYEAEVTVKQKDFSPLLLGTWDVQTMQRQSGREEETLKNVYVTFQADSVFTGKGGCNNIRGSYILKGSSIKFSNIISTKMACDVMEQEAAYLQLLEQSISTFSVDGNSLQLRDGASNIVIRASKR